MYCSSMIYFTVLLLLLLSVFSFALVQFAYKLGAIENLVAAARFSLQLNMCQKIYFAPFRCSEEL